MILNEIELEGFLSYRTRQVVNFERFTTVLVGGATGAGKSSLFEACAVCWYGKKASRGKLLDELINDDSNTVYIRCDIEHENICYRRVRSWSKTGKAKNSLQELKNGEYVEIAKDTDADTKSIEILGSWELFCTIYLKQKGIVGFIEGDSGFRKAILRELLSCEVYQNASEVATKQLSQIQNEINLKTNEIESLKQISSSENDSVEKLKELEKTVIDLQKIETFLKKEIANTERKIEIEKIERTKNEEFEDKIQKLQTLEKELKKTIHNTKEIIEEIQNDNETFGFKLAQLKKVNYDEQKTTIQSNIDRIRKYETMAVSVSETLELEIVKLHKSHTELLSEIGVLKSNIEDIDEKIEKINNADGFCPILEKECTLVCNDEYIESLTNSKGEKQKKLKEKQNTLQIIKKSVERIKEEINQIEEQNQLIVLNQNNLKTLTLKLENTKQLSKQHEQQIQQYEQQIEKNKASLKTQEKIVKEQEKQLQKNQDDVKKFTKFDNTRLLELKQLLKDKKEQLQEIQQEKIVLSEKIGGLKAEIKTHKLNKVKVKTLSGALVLLKKEKTIQEKLVFVFGKNGIQKSIMKSAVPELEILSTKLLRMFCPYTDISIKFELDPKTKDGELKSQGGLDISVVKNGKLKNIALYSGGETTQITFAIYLSLSELSSRRAGKQLQTLIVDERISGLDEDGIKRFANIIDYIRSQYKRCIVITHITQLKDLFEKTLTVYKLEDESFIEEA